MRAGAALSVLIPGFDIPLSIEGGYAIEPDLVIGAYGEYGYVLEESKCSGNCWTIRTGAQALMYDSGDGSAGAFTGLSLGYGWAFERETFFESQPATQPPAPPPPPPEPTTRTNVHDAPEVGLVVGMDFPIGGTTALGPFAATAFALADDLFAVHFFELGIRGRFGRFGGSFVAGDDANGRGDEIPRLGAGIRAFMSTIRGAVIGFGAEGAYYPLGELGVGAQVASMYFDHGADGSSYCTQCLFHARQIGAFAEGRLVPSLVVTPYARLLAGVADLSGRGSSETSRFEGAYASLAGELGLDAHGSGLSCRVFGFVLDYPAADIDHPSSGFGLQLGTLF